MKLLGFSLLGSMLALTPIVNSQENSSAKSAPSARKDEISQLISALFKSGEDNPFKEHIAPIIGLPGPMPAKGVTIAEEHHGDDKNARECYVVYEQLVDAAGGKIERPFCIYFREHKISGHDDEVRYFRIKLDGQLDKVVLILGKRDDDGKIVPGAGVARDQDINSSESKMEFSAELIAMKKWLKAQRKHLLAKGGSSAASAAATAAP